MVEKEISTIINQPLVNMWRYAGHQVFAFGPEIEDLMEDDSPAVITNCGLIIACGCIITGPDRFVLGSQHFGMEGKREDQYAQSFYNLVGDDGIVARELTFDKSGGIEIDFSDGYSLKVTPAIDLEPWEDQWRFMAYHHDPRGQLVLGSESLYWAGDVLKESS